MRQHTSVTIVALLSAGLFLTGCQLFDSSTRQPAPRSASVMSMWELYRHCQSSGDVETVLSAAKQLQQSADTHVVPAPDVPKSLDRFVTRQQGSGSRSCIVPARWMLLSIPSPPSSRPLKKSAAGVLAPFRVSTYRRGYALALHSLRPCWTAFLNRLQAVRLEYLIAADSKKYKSGGAEPTTC